MINVISTSFASDCEPLDLTEFWIEWPGDGSSKFWKFLSQIEGSFRREVFFKDADWLEVTVEAFGFKNIFIAETNLDTYNPIIIRSSLGAVFNLNIFKLSFDQIKQLLKKEKFKIIISDVDAEIHYGKVNLKEKIALVMGPEKSKVSNDFKKISDHTIKIPMFGKVDSLNLSVASSIILSESVNQRKIS